MSHLRKNIYRIIFLCQNKHQAILHIHTAEGGRLAAQKFRASEHLLCVFSECGKNEIPISVDVDVDKKVTERLSFIIIFCQYARRNFMFP